MHSPSLTKPSCVGKRCYSILACAILSRWVSIIFCTIQVHAISLSWLVFGGVLSLFLLNITNFALKKGVVGKFSIIIFLILLRVVVLSSLYFMP